MPPRHERVLKPVLGLALWACMATALPRDSQASELPRTIVLEGQIVRPFGLVFQRILGVFVFHTGIDVAVRRRALLVRAPWTGCVSGLELESGGRRVLSFDDGRGDVLTYRFRGRAMAGKGRCMRTGAPLARVAPGGHVHVERRRAGRLVDPTTASVGNGRQWP